MTPQSHLGLVRKARANLNSKQLWALKELVLWRDKMGRAEDECQLCPTNHMMLKIATEQLKELEEELKQEPETAEEKEDDQ